MTTKTKYLNATKSFALCALLFSIGIIDCNAAVVDRNNSRRPAASASRVPTMTARINAEKETAAEPAQKAPQNTSESTAEEKIDYEGEEYIIEDKTSIFEETISDVESSGRDTSSSSLADKIREQRAALDAQDKASESTQKMKNAAASGKNACDQGLRKCMQEKCGQDYSKCAGDTDTMWGNKMESCRRDLPCTGHEYTLFTIEIKADRDMNARISGYNSIIECGNSYNNCIFTECGKTFEKCLGKKAGDKAIQKCEKIAKNCKQQDSGLSARMMDAFGTVRQDAEKSIQRDEKRLYELRDAMRDTCGRLGAMFDERTLDCVYTVNFFAGDKNTLYASKKAYAGGTFNCDQNWFGVDITTFKENAFRATREQSSATSALLGAGVGTAVGAVTSGAIDRAIDRHKAEKALDDAQDEHCENYPDEPGCEEYKEKAEKKAQKEAKKAEKKAKKEAKKEDKEEDDDDDSKDEEGTDDTAAKAKDNTPAVSAQIDQDLKTDNDKKVATDTQTINDQITQESNESFENWLSGTTQWGDKEDSSGGSSSGNNGSNNNNSRGMELPKTIAPINVSVGSSSGDSSGGTTSTSGSATPTGK